MYVCNRKSWYIAYCRKIFSKLRLYDYVIVLNLLPICQRLNESTTERSVERQDGKLATRLRHNSALRLNMKSPRGRLWFTNNFTDILLIIQRMRRQYVPRASFLPSYFQRAWGRGYQYTCIVCQKAHNVLTSKIGSFLASVVVIYKLSQCLLTPTVGVNNCHKLAIDTDSSRDLHARCAALYTRVQHGQGPTNSELCSVDRLMFYC